MERGITPFRIFRLEWAADHIGSDLIERESTAHCHRVGEFAAEFFGKDFDAFRAAAVYGCDVWAGDEDAVCSHRESFEDLRAAADAAVNEYLHCAA